MHHAIGSLRAALPVSPCLIAACVAVAANTLGAEYHYTRIVGNDDPRLIELEYNGVPALNNHGLVVFGARTETGEGLFTSQGGVVSTLVDTSGQFASLEFEEVSVNDSGVVAFLGELQTGERGIFTLDQGALTTIALTGDRFSQFSGASINDAGTVAFWAYGASTDVAGVYTGDGSQVNTLAETVSLPGPGPDSNEIHYGPIRRQQPNINNHGDVVFFASHAIDGEPGSGSGVFISSGNEVSQIADTSGDFVRFYENARASINDNGAVAFQGRARTDTGFEKGVYLYSDGELTKIADNTGVNVDFLHDLTDVMLNNEGVVAFGGVNDIRSTGLLPGLYVGDASGVQNIVVPISPVPHYGLPGVRFWGQGFNDRGQVAFFSVHDRGGAIWLATPVPEPASALSATAALATLACQRRRLR